MGLVALKNLLSRCSSEHIPIAVWPFDGLSISDRAYTDAHVLLEPYPTAVREAHVMQSDASDALASAAHVQSADRTATLERLLDLSRLDAVQADVVRFEGWIISHLPALT